MRQNKINLDEYKVNYPNSQKSYKKIYDLNIPYRAIFQTPQEIIEYFTCMILLALTLTQIIRLISKQGLPKKERMDS